MTKYDVFKRTGNGLRTVGKSIEANSARSALGKYAKKAGLDGVAKKSRTNRADYMVVASSNISNLELR